MVLSRETLYLAVLCTVDMILTAIFLSTGSFTEANPILAHYLRYGLGVMCLVKMLSYLVPLAIAEWYRRKHPRFIRYTLRIALYLYIFGYIVGIAATNVSWLLF